MYVLSLVVLWAVIAFCGLCMVLFSGGSRLGGGVLTAAVVGLPLAGAAYYGLARPRVELLGWQFGVAFCLWLAGGAAIGCLCGWLLSCPQPVCVGLPCGTGSDAGGCGRDEPPPVGGCGWL